MAGFVVKNGHCIITAVDAVDFAVQGERILFAGKVKVEFLFQRLCVKGAVLTPFAEGCKGAAEGFVQRLFRITGGAVGVEGTVADLGSQTGGNVSERFWISSSVASRHCFFSFDRDCPNWWSPA